MEQVTSKKNHLNYLTEWIDHHQQCKMAIHYGINYSSFQPISVELTDAAARIVHCLSTVNLLERHVKKSS